MDDVVLLAELRALVETAPDFAAFNSTSRVHHEWLGKAFALVAQWNRIEALTISSAADFLNIQITRESNVGKIFGVIHRAIADLELRVPAKPAQAFGPGAVYDFLKSLRDLLGSATQEILIVDPYLDEEIFDAYLASVSRNVSVRLLAREYAGALKHAVGKFAAQHKMRVDARVSDLIHDRVIFLDRASCWVLGQSIRNAAKAKPTYLAPLDADTARLKLVDYETIWNAAKPI